MDCKLLSIDWDNPTSGWHAGLNSHTRQIRQLCWQLARVTRTIIYYGPQHVLLGPLSGTVRPEPCPFGRKTTYITCLKTTLKYFTDSSLNASLLKGQTMLKIKTMCMPILHDIPSLLKKYTKYHMWPLCLSYDGYDMDICFTFDTNDCCSNPSAWYNSFCRWAASCDYNLN